MKHGGPLGRNLIEGVLLSVGVVSCLVSAVDWYASHGPDEAAAALSDGRFWQAVLTSLQIGGAVGVTLALLATTLGSVLLFANDRPSALVVIAAVSAAMAPDVVHALIWRSAIQPNSAILWPEALHFLAGDTRGQFLLLCWVIALKWLPLAVIVVAVTAPAKRAVLFTTSAMSGLRPFQSLLLAFAPHLARMALYLFVFGLVLGLRQHEFSETLFAGGAAFLLEGLSQWATKVALSFLDPGRAALQVLAILVAVGLGAALLFSVSSRIASRA